MYSLVHVWTIHPLICKLHTSFKFGFVTYTFGIFYNALIWDTLIALEDYSTTELMCFVYNKSTCINIITPLVHDISQTGAASMYSSS